MLYQIIKLKQYKKNKINYYITATARERTKKNKIKTTIQNMLEDQPKRTTNYKKDKLNQMTCEH